MWEIRAGRTLGERAKVAEGREAKVGRGGKGDLCWGVWSRNLTVKTEAEPSGDQVCGLVGQVRAFLGGNGSGSW